jgi:hypothetical protein
MAMTGDAVAKARAEFGGLGPAIDVLNREGRLQPIEPPSVTAFGEFVAKYHLGDPQDTRDAWRPVRRRERLNQAAHEATDEVLREVKRAHRRRRVAGEPRRRIFRV